jgi:dihydrofolate synthase/folylpolyglutamate synthase
MSASVRHDTTDARYAAAIDFLHDRVDYERALAVPYHGRHFSLDRTRELLARLGNPQQKYPIVHVAGTKGKGSTAAMIAAVLTAAGYRTGLFTSPHLDRVEERIAVDGRPSGVADMVDLVERLTPAVQAMDSAPSPDYPGENCPTYFEITTAMALVHFAARRVDAAILEVGLGGRLDSTNVCDPEVSVITSISFDHTRQLGSTLEAIAAEKAGIIKAGVPVVSGVLEPGPREVIRRVSRQIGSSLHELGVDFDFRYTPPRALDVSQQSGRIDFHYHADGKDYALVDVALGLLGGHQGANAAVALAAVERLRQSGWSIPEPAIRVGLGGLTWPARVELIQRRPAIVIDAAHNVASITALIRVLNESFSPRRRILVFATTQEKDMAGMLACLLGQFDEVILTQYLDSPRAVPLEQLDAAARELTGRQCRLCPRPADAWDEVRGLAAADDLICVTGSFLIAAQMRAEIRDRPGRDNEPEAGTPPPT